jgi:hypothetical protein
VIIAPGKTLTLPLAVAQYSQEICMKLTGHYERGNESELHTAQVEALRASIAVIPSLGGKSAK